MMTSSTSRAEISVIVPTQARRDRAASLLRALDSIVSQAGALAVPIVVVNGAERDPALLATLVRRTDIRLATLDTAGIGAALRFGRELVDTPYFAVLDDDDYLLPNAFARQLEAMDGAPPSDAIIANGIVRDPKERLVMHDVARIGADPLRALIENNWLVPGAALFRTAGVPPHLFDGMPPYLEWTYLAVRMTARCRLHFINQAVYVHPVDPPASPWDSRARMLGLPAALERILELDLPADIQIAFQRKLAAACHHAADSELRAGQIASALGWHLRSLIRHRDWRRLFYGRKFAPALWRQLAAVKHAEARSRTR